VDEGSGPTLLLLHGNGSWSFLYRHVISRLAGHFRCIALDHAGFGLSQARLGFSFKPREHSAVLESFCDAERTDWALQLSNPIPRASVDMLVAGPLPT
jgi:haloalkane dehalogenase